MRPELDDTHDPSLRSWVEAANDDANNFPIQNLPFGVFSVDGEDEDDARVGVAIGDHIVDLAELVDARMFPGLDSADEPLIDDVAVPMLNLLMMSDATRVRGIRQRLSELLSEGNDELRKKKKLVERALVPMEACELHMPVDVGDFTDFYASKHHATNVGSMFRPDNPLLPNYVHIPVGYHGRSSSVIVSGEAVTRPNGQTKADDADRPSFGPCKLLDYEMEVGLFIGGEDNELGEPVPLRDAWERLWGVVLLNDWSARDMQKWEYQPLGPFLAKSFASTISPWVVTRDALAPFRCAVTSRTDADPDPLEHLYHDDDQSAGMIDMTVEVYLLTEQMRKKKVDAVRLSSGSYRDMFWTPGQMIAHHASNGCNLEAGDLLGSGTISGPERESRGCLLELTWNGSATDPKPGSDRSPIVLPTGEERVFLQDGDEVIMRGYCEREGARRIGFGECRAVVEPAPKA
ncbi:MAG: fumarylacetoacetase [Planctomycetota bacterium]